MSVELAREIFISECLGREHLSFEGSSRMKFELSAEIVNMDDWDRASSTRKEIQPEPRSIEAVQSESLLLGHKK